MADADVGLPPSDARRTVEAPPARSPGRHPPVADLLAPSFLAFYVLIAFEPFLDLVPLPGFVASVLVPGVGIATLLVTPTDRIRRIPVSLGLAVLVGWLATTQLWSLVPAATSFTVRAQLVPIVVLVLVVGTMQVRVIIATLLAVMTAVIAWSLLISIGLPSGRVVHDPPEPPQVGFHGTFGHKNLLGVFAVYGLALGLAVRKIGPLPKVLAVLSAIAIVGTRSATAGAGLLAVVFARALLSALQRQRSSRERQFFAVAAGSTFLAAVLLVVGSLPTLVGLYGKDLTFSGRTKIWATSVGTIAEEPIFGYGVGAVWADEHLMLTRRMRAEIGFDAAHAHNAVLEVALSGGIPAVLAVAAFLGGIAVAAGRALSRRRTAPIGEWAFASLAAVFLMGISEPLIQGPHLGLLGVVSTTVMLATRRPRWGPVRHERSTLGA